MQRANQGNTKLTGISGVILGLLASASIVAAQDIGVQGPSTGAVVGPATETKPQSKVWFNDGSWWGSLWSVAGGAFHIQRLESDGVTWTDTGVLIDGRPDSKSDVLWDGGRLYVASHVFTTGAGSDGEPIELSRYSYDPGPRSYALDPGFPVTIGNTSTESLVIDRDSSGMVWAVWMDNLRVQVAHTMGNDETWSSPMVLPGNNNDVTVDDICSLIHFNGDRIGVFWSDQAEEAFLFAFHIDGMADDQWSSVEVASSGAGSTDDHINLAADNAGRVFAATKNADDEIPLLVRGSGGGWSEITAAEGSAGLTRPIVVLNEEADRIHIFASDRPGGSINEKTSSLSSISFAAGAGMPVIRDASNVEMNNATSTKQIVDSSTGLLVLATNDVTGLYWHHFVEPITGGGDELIANFTASQVTGVAPLTVQFTDTSIGSPTAWSWDFGDGSNASQQNPEHVYLLPGTFTVSLTVDGPGGPDTATRQDLIVVTEEGDPPPGGGGLVLSGPMPGIAGTLNTWHVTGATGNAYVAYIASHRFGSDGVAFAPCGVLTTALLRPRLFGFNVSTDGTSTIYRNVPLAFRGRQIHFQAIDVATCRVSDVVTNRF